MGTINYKSNDFINLGYDLSHKNYYVKINDTYEIETEINYLYETITDLINSYNLEYFKIDIQQGYYEGFYIDIDFEYCYFDNYREKQEAQKEITRIKKLLYNIIDYGHIVNCQNGWCTTYYTQEETKEEIKEAIKKMRETVKETITGVKQYERFWYMV